MKPNHNEIANDIGFIKNCLVHAGQMAAGQRGQRTASIKADLTPVTEVDRQVEEYLIGQIKSQYPTHHILSEETGLHPASGSFTWVIDPIDGTRAFASGLPIWGVSIGVLRERKPCLGGFYMPVTGEMYWSDCQAAFYNDVQISTDRAISIDSPLAFLAVPSEFHKIFAIEYPRVRSFGSTAAHLAYVATGSAVGALLSKYSLWDLAGLMPALQALDISITTLSGQSYDAVDLIDGSHSSQPLLIARTENSKILRDGIRLL